MDKQMTIVHKELSRGRWKEFSLVEQMAHIGSEISRALNWQKKGNREYCHKALDRALELLSLTLEECSRSSVCRELTRLRETLLDYFYGENRFGSSETLWRKYFDHFNVAARKNREN